MADSPVLEEDVAIVTGAGRNIGQKIAERFATEGAQVAVADIDRSRARETVEQIRESGNEAMIVEVDITDETQVREMVESVESQYGAIDILVNNAAVMDRDTLLDLDVERFDQVLDVNLRGTFICTREVAKSMRDSGGGRIVNLASTSAHNGRTDAVAYATSKSGILNFTRSAAKALAPHDIRVNTLSPTSSGTRTLPAESDDNASVKATLTEERAERIRANIPVGRIGTPEDQANAALYLVSPQSEFVTGAELVVDGGRMA
jgi:NAD(P)-dependent dehydrogenase (short-subunit alcohol dehydrogenase family)